MTSLWVFDQCEHKVLLFGRQLAPSPQRALREFYNPLGKEETSLPSKGFILRPKEKLKINLVSYCADGYNYSIWMIVIVSSWLFDDDDDDDVNDIDDDDNNDNGKTISWSFYFILLVKSLGCYKDTARRAVPQMDGRNPLVTGYYRKRADAILRCGLVAKRFGFRVFAVQHQGWCATGPRAHLTYRKYGRSNKCRNGKGGPWANDVYRVYGEENIWLRWN